MAAIPFGGARPPGGAACAAAGGSERLGRQVAGQAAELRAGDRLVDRLVDDMLRRLARNWRQRPADLFRAPSLLQPALHELAQRLVAVDLARPGPGLPPSGQLVRGERPVLLAARLRLCLSSRPIVDGLRPSRSAIACIRPRPAQAAICTR